MLIRTIIYSIFFFCLAIKSASAMTYGIVTEYNNTNLTDENGLAQAADISLGLNNGLNLKYETLENIYLERYHQLNNVPAVIDYGNDDLVEFIGMFISDYKSRQDVKFKLRVTDDIQFEQLSIQWKLTF